MKTTLFNSSIEVPCALQTPSKAPKRPVEARFLLTRAYNCLGAAAERQFKRRFKALKAFRRLLKGLVEDVHDAERLQVAVLQGLPYAYKRLRRDLEAHITVMKSYSSSYLTAHPISPFNSFRIHMYIYII